MTVKVLKGPTEKVDRGVRIGVKQIGEKIESSRVIVYAKYERGKNIRVSCSWPYMQPPPTYERIFNTLKEKLAKHNVNLDESCISFISEIVDPLYF